MKFALDVAMLVIRASVQLIITGLMALGRALMETGRVHAANAKAGKVPDKRQPRRKRRRR
ncbi:hypothetical protein ACSBOB_20265 [Mesorhizobium sp. ASY16-5R]|uniref:hypothetical protein n=1 Tax=Mesorhizobium sp. ASY16-5R TaxID=3445772 RepID=UPI003FA02F13